jgi:hypothetical protein
MGKMPNSPLFHCVATCRNVTAALNEELTVLKETKGLGL